jgi:phage gpG-like protein
MRRAFHWYPEEVWRYLLAAAWARIDQEEHLMGRAAQGGSDLGSALIAARLVRDIMRLAFLMERQYAPYPKWFGRAFEALDCAPRLQPDLERVLRVDNWKARDAALVGPYQELAAMHNALGLTKKMPETVMPFHGRPFQVMGLHGFRDALLETLGQGFITAMLARSPVGGIDLISDNTDFLEEPALRRSLAALLRSAGS